MIKLPSYQKSIIIGLILSDGWIGFYKPNSKNTRLGFGQSGSPSKYFWSVFFSLAPYFSSYPVVRNITRFGKQTISLQFITR
jgi:hypothetical protein